VVLQRRRHRQFAAVQGGIADAVQAWLVGQDLDDDVVAARAGDDRADFGDLHRKKRLLAVRRPL
jgi:hypothetical protein